MDRTGKKYTVARRMIIAERHQGGHEPVALRVYLNPHLDLELTGKPVLLSMLVKLGPQPGPEDAE